MMKKRIYLCLLIIYALITSFATANRLVLEKSSTEGVSNNTGKYYCPYYVDVKIVYGGVPFADAQYYVKYNHLNESLSLYQKGDWNGTTDNGENKVIGNNVDTVRCNYSNKDNITNNFVSSTLLLTGINVYEPGTWLKFVNVHGEEQTQFTMILSDELYVSNGQNTLTSVSGLYIPYEACPCQNDNKSPVWLNSDVENDRGVEINSNLTITGMMSVTGLVNDRDTNNQTQYWYSGSKQLVPTNYTGVPNGLYMDNQVGVDGGTVVVKITHGANKLHTQVQNEIFTGGVNLHLSGIGMTWNSNDRGYWINFKNSIEYDIERPVTISIVARDNPLNMGNGSVCNRSAMTMPTKEYTFNAISKPTITLISPQNDQNNVSTTTAIKLRVADSWAGVDTGTLKITISEISEMSGEDKIVLFTGYTYSGHELKFDNCSGTPISGGRYSCDVTINLLKGQEFPSNTGIKLTGYVEDFVKNVNDENVMKFTTRQSASYFGCGKPITIYYVSGALTELPVDINIDFTGSIVVLTGIVDNNKGVDGTMYPRFERIGENCDENNGEGCREILMCTPLNIHPNLTGNIKVRSGSNEYTGSLDITGLYITGLNWSYQSGVIIIND